MADLTRVPPAFQAVPIFRVFDLEKARDFYVGFLGFQVDCRLRFSEPIRPAPG